MPRVRKKPKRVIPQKIIIDFTKAEIRGMLRDAVAGAGLITGKEHKITLHFATDNEIDLPAGMAASLVIITEETDEQDN